MDRYAERYGIASGDDFERFATLIRRMDRTFLKMHAEKMRAEAEAAKQTGR